jgi:hypothetical protein
MVPQSSSLYDHLLDEVSVLDEITDYPGLVFNDETVHPVEYINADDISAVHLSLSSVIRSHTEYDEFHMPPDSSGASQSTEPHQLREYVLVWRRLGSSSRTLRRARSRLNHRLNQECLSRLTAPVCLVLTSPDRSTNITKLLSEAVRCRQLQASPLLPATFPSPPPVKLKANNHTINVV